MRAPRTDVKATDKQVLSYIREYHAQNVCSPTFRVLMDAFGYSSPATLQSRISRLISQGLLKRLPGTRGVVVTEKGLRSLEYEH